MTRRTWLLLGVTTPAAFAQASQSLRGPLTVSGNTAAIANVTLQTDPETFEVLRDERVPRDDFEVLGQRYPDHFRVDPIHKQALFVHQNGKRLLVTYWCAVCYIRTYTPGLCVCCRDQTELDLITPEDLARKNSRAA